MTTVLIVEDNLTLLETIAFELEMQGFTVLQATDGKNGLQVLQIIQDLPDIIVSDIAMPDMDGYQFLERVRLIEEWQSIPFIFLTAFDSPNAIRIGKELGVDDYLTKPFRAEDLVIAINNKIKRYQQIHNSAERRLDKTRRELLNIISHELFTPLTSVYGGTEMLADNLANIPDAMTQQMLNLVKNGAQRMNGLVHRITLMLQIDSGQLERIFKQTAQVYDISSLIEESLAQIKKVGDLENQNVQIDCQVPQEPLFVRGVHPFLVAILVEGIRNAIKFSPANSHASLEVTYTPTDINIVMTDHGTGIPSDKIAHIWNRFQQIDRDEHEQQGMGLGLAIIKEATALHGGHVNMTSQQGVGTELTITLPHVKNSDAF